MRKTIASISVFILVVSLLLTSCGKKRTFEPSGVTGEKAETAKSQRGEIKLEPDKFTFYGVQMGMTTDQVQVSVGKAAQVYARNDKMFLTEDVKVNEFKNGLDRVVYYIFNTNNQLVEVQYVVSSSDGVSYQNAVTLPRHLRSRRNRDTERNRQARNNLGIYGRLRYSREKRRKGRRNFIYAEKSL